MTLPGVSWGNREANGTSQKRAFEQPVGADEVRVGEEPQPSQLNRVLDRPRGTRAGAEVA